MKRFNRFVVFLVIFVVMISGINIQPVKAQVNHGVTIEFRNGNVVITVVGTKATYSTKYKTVAWFMRADAVCDDPNSPSARQECYPGTGNYGVIRMNPGDETDIPSDTNPDEITSIYTIDQSVVYEQLKAAGVNTKKGTTVYFDGIFKVYDPNGDWPGEYLSLSSIRNAAPWTQSTLMDFAYYYDLAVPLVPSPTWPQPVDIMFKKKDGSKVIDDVHLGDYPAGDPVSYSFDTPITGKDGKKYTLVQSYIETKDPPGSPQWVQNTGDANLADRNITVSNGGNNIVGIYEEVKSPVDAIYQLQDGTVLRTVPVGNFDPNQPADYTFPSLITHTDGNQYEIIQSYITTKTDPTPTFVRNTGEPNLLDRHILVSDGGNNIIGVYQPKTCAPNCPPPPGGTNGKDLTPSPSAVIKADNRDAEQFDVTQGIPTSESLYANVLTKNYLYNYSFSEKKGEKTYPVTATKTYNLTWQVQSGTDAQGNPVWTTQSSSQTVTQTYQIKRQYSYWVIPELEVYGVDRANLQNYALPSGNVTLTPNGYSPPNVNVAHSDSESDHIIEPTYPQTIDQGSQSLDGGQSGPPAVPQEDWTAQAEAAVPKIKVKNDRLIFNGSTVMSDAVTDENGPAPSSIPAGSQVNRDVLYGKGFVIDPVKANQYRAPSQGTIYYKLVAGVNPVDNGKNFPIPGINYVTVHTPVVNYSYTTDDQAHNQKTVPTPNRNAFILDRPFSVTMPTTGQHLNIKGYGNRDYAKYTKNKQVWFPFDVFTADLSKFIPKQTWIDIPVTQNTFDFYLPVWVDEGNYDVLFREIAINSPASGFQTQPNANTRTPTIPYVATQTIPVEVIGRVYDFHITDIADYNWQSVFRQSDGTTPTGASYWVGDRSIDGAPRGNSSPYLLPVRQGSHPNAGSKNVAVKTGYHIKFDLKTKGNMFGPNDGVRITPTFFFVPRNGSSRQQVDLYYRTNDQPFVKIGSPDDKEKRYVILNDPLRNLPNQEIVDTATYLYNHGYSFSGVSSLSGFLSTYFRNAEKKTWVGDYSLMLLTQPLRTFIGPKGVPSGVDAGRANASDQKWYGEYSLPSAPYVVPKGTNLADYGRMNGLDDKSPIFLKDGYIVVNFNIETIRNQNINAPHLQYINGPRDNQWQMEGFRRSITDPYGNKFNLSDGDVVFYHADKSSRDDFDSSGSH
jgi:hypothetical protein